MIADQTPRLTSLSPGAGCACKLPLAKLEALFAAMGPAPFVNTGPVTGDLLIGAAAGAASALLGALRDQGLPAAPIGEVVAGEPGHIHVHHGSF